MIYCHFSRAGSAEFMNETTSQRIDAIDLRGVKVAPDTSWIFVSVKTADQVGIGEASLLDRDAEVAAVAAQYSEQLIGQPVSSMARIFTSLPFATLPEASFSSAVMQALCDIDARTRQCSVAAVVGEMQRTVIPAYANINRATRDRTPDGFAATARQAASEGYTAFKIAPFDEVQPDMDRKEMAAAAVAGCQRVARVREVVGDNVRLMVDCHWRFSPQGSLDLVDALSELSLHWLECPMVENDDTLDSIKAVRDRANGVDMLLAGCEKSILQRGFDGFLKTGAYDVMMPDVKYAGGPHEMLEIEKLFGRYGVEFSPHNPTGPVAHVASAQICAALPDSGLLEMQFRETELFDQIVGGNNPPVVDGNVMLDSDTRGWGLALDTQVLDELEQTVRWSSESAG